MPAHSSTQPVPPAVPVPEPQAQASTGADSRRPPPPPAGQRSLRSDDLLRGEDSVVLLHQGMRYTLRHTRQGKLILTK